MTKAATPTPVPMPAAAPVLSPCEDEVGGEARLVCVLVLMIMPVIVLVVDLGGEVVVIVATPKVDDADV
ncbi:hypothetical protein RRF57_010202 [Xylaria bambusicola]|uniref:Uncharacterized protein n=1 Tax=Xylaria bambusicola TaxID=326684 RepID=A0AAN7V3E4_9PEZI